MKNILNKITCLTAVALLFAACEKMGKTDGRVSEVKSLTEPLTGKAFELDPAASAAIYFEWSYVDQATAGTMEYQIAFDKLDGDFSAPVYILPAGNNGLLNNASISHKVMNKIAGKMGIRPTEKGTFKWTVMANKGTSMAFQPTLANEITITRLAGFEDIPIDLYLTGEATEGGSDIAKARLMTAVAGGEFEIYTQLKAGKPFFFVDETKVLTPRKFSTSGILIKEGDATSTVEQDGVYRITLDFNTGACTYTLIKSIEFYFSPEGKPLFELPYIGGGIFQAKGATVTFKQEGWGRDERYKFRMHTVLDGGKGDKKEVEWATLNGTDSRPTPTSPESYYYLKLYETPSQWENKWKLMGDFDGVPATYTVYLTADKPYTHSITK